MKLKLSNKTRAVIAAFLVTFASTAIVFLFSFSSLYHGINNDVYDFFFSLKSEPEKTEEVVIIAIDDNSVNQLMESSNWPWPRNFYAYFNQYLIQSGVKAVVYDLILSTPSSGRDAAYSSSYDNALNETLQNSPIILGYDMTSEKILGQSVTEMPSYLFPADQLPVGATSTEYEFISPLYHLLQPSIRPGFVLNPPDNDGVIRSYIPFVAAKAGAGKKGYYLSLGAATADAIQPGCLSDLNLDPEGKMLINWYGHGGAKKSPHSTNNRKDSNPVGVFEYYSAYDLYRSALFTFEYNMPDRAPIKAEYLKGKTVFIGSTVIGHGDFKVTPYSKGDKPYPGVEVHATAFLNMVNQDWVEPIISWPQFLIATLAALILAFLGINTKSYLKYSLIVLALITAFAGTEIVLFFILNWKLQLAAMLILFLMSYIFTLMANYIIVGRSRAVIKNAMGRYLSPSLLKKVMASGEAYVGGEEIVASVLFIDIAGFTTFSEQHDVSEVVRVLNFYLKNFSEIIIKNKGFVNKFLGDGLMALFGSPEVDATHADMALKSAFECYAEAVKLEAEYGLKVRIGVNSGTLIHGNIGGTSKLEFTAIGDTVNSASRMEGVNRFFETQIVAGEGCVQLAQQSFPLFYTGRFSLKGKDQPVRLYGYTPADEKEIELFEALIKSYESKDRFLFDKIIVKFEQFDQKFGPVEYYRKLSASQSDEMFGKAVKLTEK